MLKAVFSFFYFFYKLFYFMCLELFYSIVPRRKKDVAGEIVLVTGAGHGIGKEMALEFGRLGARVVIWDMNKTTNEKTAEEIRNNGGTAYSFVCDLTKTDEIHRVSERVRREVGDPYILINNAGVLYGGELLKTEEVKEFLPAMMEQNRGHIVTIASMAGKSGTAYLVDYSASKFAAYGFTEALREELRVLGKTNVETTTVCPMFVNTGLVESIKYKAGKILTPEEVSRATVYGVLTNQDVVYVPAHMNTVLRIGALLPRKMNQWLKAQSDTGIEPQYRFSSYKKE